MRHILLQRERCCSLFFFSFRFSTLLISLSTSLFRSRVKSFLDLSIERFLVNSRIISRIISALVVVVLGYSRHSRWNPPRPNDDVTLVHDSPCRTTSGFLFPFVQNEKRAKQGADSGGGGEEAHRQRMAWRCTRAREQPSLTELLPLRSLHSREAVVYAPRHPTDAELMILINVS